MLEKQNFEKYRLNWKLEFDNQKKKKTEHDLAQNWKLRSCWVCFLLLRKCCMFIFIYFFQMFLDSFMLTNCLLFFSKFLLSTFSNIIIFNQIQSIKIDIRLTRNLTQQLATQKETEKVFFFLFLFVCFFFGFWAHKWKTQRRSRQSTWWKTLYSNSIAIFDENIFVLFLKFFVKSQILFIIRKEQNLKENKIKNNRKNVYARLKLLTKFFCNVCKNEEREI